jgi:rRNA-processing protein FCF1
MNEIFVIIDANFILLPFQFKIHYLEEIEQKVQRKVKFVVFKQVIDELEAKAKREQNSSKFLLLLNSSLTYLDKYKEMFSILQDPSIKAYDETSDSFLLRKCLELKNKDLLVYLATNDKELKKKAKQFKINIIFVRQKKIISVERV